MNRRSLPILAVAFAVVGLTPTWAEDPSPTTFTCEDYVGAWKGRPATELVQKWGEPTQRKERSKGRVQMVYDLRVVAAAADRNLPPEKAFPAAKPTSGMPGDPQGEVITPPGRDAGFEYSKGKDGKWEKKSGGDDSALPEGPHAYVFDVDADGIIVKVRCKD